MTQYRNARFLEHAYSIRVELVKSKPRVIIIVAQLMASRVVRQTAAVLGPTHIRPDQARPVLTRMPDNHTARCTFPGASPECAPE